MTGIGCGIARLGSVVCSSWQSFLQERPYATAYWPFSVMESCTSNANPPTYSSSPIHPYASVYPVLTVNETRTVTTSYLPDTKAARIPEGFGRPFITRSVAHIPVWEGVQVYFLAAGTSALFLAAGATVASAFSLEKMPSPIPLTFFNSSTDLKAPCC